MKKYLSYLSVLIIFLLIGIISAENSDIIKIKEVIPSQNNLIVNYSFDNSNIIGNSATIIIWLTNGEGIKFQETSDSFPLNKEGLIERESSIKIPDNLTGVCFVNLALNYDLSNPINQSFTIERSSITGRSILENLNENKINYPIVVVVLFICIAIWIFFVVNSPKKEEENAESEQKNRWLLRKPRLLHA